MDQVTTTSPMLQMSIRKMTGDMNFVGIFYIIMGGLYCLTIIGALIGVPFIISGLRLRESADGFTGYIVQGDSFMLEKAIDRQAKFFFIQKVLMIIALVLIVLYIIGIILFFSFFMQYFQGEYLYNT